MGWSNVGAVVLEATQVILLDNVGNIIGTLDGTNGLVIYGNGTAANPGLQLNGAGDMRFGGTGFGVPLTLDMTIEAGGTLLSSGNQVVGLFISSGAVDVLQKQSSVSVLSSSTDDMDIPQVMLAPRAVTANPTVSGDPQAEVWHAPALLHGWANAGGAFGPSGYRLAVDGSTVQLRGVISGGTKVDGTVLFTLPAGYRPPRTRLCVAAGAANGTFVGLSVLATGDVLCEGIGAQSAFMGLDNAQFTI